MASQQSVLRESMHRLDLTRNAFAERLGVSRRALDTWLLPTGSGGHRAMPKVVARMIASLPGLGDASADSSGLRERLGPHGKPHLLSVDVFDRALAEEVLRVADSMEPIARRQKVTRVLEGAVLGNLFFEPSTRTRVSFGAAFCRLGGAVCDTTGFTFSSMAKGESIADTSRVISGYVDAIVVRHPEQGSVAQFAAATNVPVINGGDGPGEHPTQALLDLYTIDEELGGIAGLHVAIVGDVLHSRVARSDIQALVLMGARVTVVGPPPLIPRGIEAMGCEVSSDMASIAAADVVYVLRMQNERMQEGANYVPSLREYTARWGVTPARLRPGQKVMHPGPMNRGVEIDPTVADDQDALIVTQVRAGLVVRMAVLYDLLTHGPALVEAAARTPLGVA
jgi:aspartate carbamoyltransferase catalytic subunit